MWARKKQQTAPVDTPDLDELIQSLRGVVATNARPEVVGQLISLLTIRGTLEVQTERPERALEDRRAAAGLLRGFDGQPSPADRHTDLLARMALVAAERAAGNLDAAMDAAVWAIDHIGPVRTEDTDVCEAFVADLDRLRGDLNAANVATSAQGRGARERPGHAAGRAGRVGVHGAAGQLLGQRGGRARQRG